jgi:hypothetical protein
VSRYVKRSTIRPTSRLYVEDHTFADEGPMLPNIDVDSSECADTGLIWGDGSVIWRAPNPIGFGRDGEWM